LAAQVLFICLYFIFTLLFYWWYIINNMWKRCYFLLKSKKH